MPAMQTILNLLSAGLARQMYSSKWEEFSSPTQVLSVGGGVWSKREKGVWTEVVRGMDRGADLEVGEGGGGGAPEAQAFHVGQVAGL